MITFAYLELMKTFILHVIHLLLKLFESSITKNIVILIIELLNR